MIKAVVKSKGNEAKTSVKVRCKGAKTLLAETAAIVAAVCRSAQGNVGELTPEVIMELAKNMLEDKGACIKEE